MRCKDVLIVEDDPGIRQALKLALEMEGYGVLSAADGKEGLKLLSQVERPCLILLDLMMPVMDGWAFAEAIQQDMTLAQIPIAVVTAFGDKAKTFKGAKTVIKKPVDLDLLFKIVHTYCG